MPTYVSKIPFDIEFDGQKVAGELRPLLFTDALKLRTVSKSGAEEEEAVAAYASLLPSYLVSMTAILDAHGATVPNEEAFKTTFYAGLVAAIMRIHVSAASVPNPPLPDAAHAD